MPTVTGSLKPPRLSLTLLFGHFKKNDRLDLPIKYICSVVQINDPDTQGEKVDFTFFD